MRSARIGISIVLLGLTACASDNLTAYSATAQNSGATAARDVLVKTPEAYAKAAESARPGDRIILADGVWRDFEIALDADGTEQAPIELTAQTPGKVVLSGQSSLRMAGSHLVVSGLIFKDGYTPRSEVISFRIDSARYASHSRVTQTVIENYSNPDRRQVDIWVALYGRNNRFDHNHLAGKLNAGPTMAVRLNSEESRNNEHRIEFNYFGPRPVFGSNGGETLRIGTSAYSLTRSGTLVEHNYFDRCSGEVEIISNKSGGNTFRGNTFFESRGTLTLRHGGDTLVEDNLFDGNGAPFTGGVRVINPRQTVRNNYFRRLTGTRFSGAMVVMNGVPDSPINRYHQVDGAVIENNTFENVAAIELGEGADAERSARPVNSVFRNNLVVTQATQSPFNLYDDMSGVSFSENAASAIPPVEIAAGFQIRKVEDPNGPYLSPTGGAGAAGPFGVAREATGVTWHPKPASDSRFSGGRDIAVAPGDSAIWRALQTAGPGDTLVLAGGTYVESKIIELNAPVTIRAADADDRPSLVFERSNLFLLSGDGSLILSGLSVSGAEAPDSTGNSFIATNFRVGGGNHVVRLMDMDFRDFDVNKSFSIITANKSTFFDSIEIMDSKFKDVSGPVVRADSEIDDFGVYNVEFLSIANSEFQNIAAPVASIYRGGTDESTFGPNVSVTGSKFNDIGKAGAPLMLLHGVQNFTANGNTAEAAQPISIVITTGLPTIHATGNSARGSSNAAFVTTTDLRGRS
ncbi:MAG: polysaccharide lyase 6 family protein [Amphiplicatus sp.]